MTYKLQLGGQSLPESVVWWRGGGVYNASINFVPPWKVRMEAMDWVEIWLTRLSGIENGMVDGLPGIVSGDVLRGIGGLGTGVVFSWATTARGSYA